MGSSNLLFVLMIIIDGCAGPLDRSGTCSVQNFSIRVPFESPEQCEAARRGMNVPGGAQRFVSAICTSSPPARAQ